MKKYIYILLAIFLMLVGCKKEEILVDNQIKVGLVKLEVEVKSGVVFYRGDKLENHLSSFVLVGTYSNGARKNLEIKREYVKEFDLSSFDQGTIRIEVDGIGVEVKVEVIDRDANLIFREYFDTQADWHSGLEENFTNPYINDGLINPVNKTQRLREGNKLPLGWTGVYQDGQKFSPRNGYVNTHENIEILAKNQDKAMGGQGKSAVFWRESHGGKDWNSDGTLHRYFDQGYDELYIEFWIKFDSNITIGNNESSKIFRVESWNGEGSEFQGFIGGNLGPMLLWNWKTDAYGVRNVITSRGGPYGENYMMPTGESIGGSHNFTTSIKNQGIGGETEWPIDRKNGGLVKDNMQGGIALHKQVFGNKEQWSKLAFYVKMNSEIDKKDGIFIQWLNGRRIMTRESIPWVKSGNYNKMVKWNAFAIGGNDHFNTHPLEDVREEWYSIDNVRVYDGIPSHAEEDINFE